LEAPGSTIELRPRCAKVSPKDKNGNACGEDNGSVDRVLLARHAESEFSVLGLTNGDPSIEGGLTERGREQARHLGRALAAVPIDVCATSEFQRTRETADIALGGREIERLVVPELNDIRFGEFEGRPLADYRAWARTHGPEDPVPGGGETRAATVARYVAGFRKLLGLPERTILVVSHGLPIRYVLNAAAAQPPMPAIEQVPYAEPFELTAPELTKAVELLGHWTRGPTWPR
jgi:broad specificity phosphatase PhoE